MNSLEVREKLVEALDLDLVGPTAGGPLEKEVLPQAPSRWYLTGFLVPYQAKADQKSDALQTEEIDQAVTADGDDDRSPDRATPRKAFFPSSMGVSVLVPKAADTLSVLVQWGDYKAVAEAVGGEASETGPKLTWKRTQRKAVVEVPVGKTVKKPLRIDVSESSGLQLVVSIRTVPGGEKVGLVPAGTRAVSIFLVNGRTPEPDEKKDQGFIFQVGLTIRSEKGFVKRPNIRGLTDEDWDEKVADLQFRDCYEFAVGHGVSTRSDPGSDGDCREVSTAWIPTWEVEKVEPAQIDGVELSMDTLSTTADYANLRKKLGGLEERYRAWIETQRKNLPAESERRKVTEELLQRATNAAGRIAAGLSALEDPVLFDAFRLANRTMATAARQRWSHGKDGKEPKDAPEPRWRPFQLAFILMNLKGIADPTNHDRSLVDLLFFPTGGGKTEAYLGLAAFTLVLRRLRNPGVASAGLSVLMRYTLRLLTLDQLFRAATLICALELERRKNVEKLGTWPFEIGLWVGLKATANRMGKKGDKDDHTARARTIRFKNDSKGKPSPIPLENCAWCGWKFGPDSFRLVPEPDHPTDLRVQCLNRRCAFKGEPPLPILAVDEPIYRRLPCFLISTVDKFANLPWVGASGALLGNVERHDKDGFYGLSEPGKGKPLPKPLLPPDLVIQDELHLISGPLGTMVGLYETAIDRLCTRREGEREIRPKIVASTATVRRAEKQIRALFARPAVEVFPPPGPDRRDSFFAVTVPTSKTPGRRYIGIAAYGRSHKLLLLRTYLGLLGAAQKFYAEHGGKKTPDNPVDPYMTLLGYFNSLRELGGSRRIVEDEVSARVQSYGRRARVGEAHGSFADRKIGYDVVELTSREPTHKVAEAKRRLASMFVNDDRVDVALATNMISVGLDIVRLGLMVVLGQPKTTAEYIQATSRVGRDETRPGLVVTLFNVHRPRDRSHYERFEAYHASFYRAVEATSVTPFSPRAIDRGLAAVTVSLARHGLAELAPPLGALEARRVRSKLDFVIDAIVRRAEEHNRELEPAEREALRAKLRARTADLLDEWAKIAHGQNEKGAGLQYQREEGGAPPLLHYPLDPDLETASAAEKKFKANRSMRDVESSVNLWVQTSEGHDLEGREE